MIESTKCTLECKVYARMYCDMIDCTKCTLEGKVY